MISTVQNSTTFVYWGTTFELSLSRMAQEHKSSNSPLNEQERIANILDKIFRLRKIQIVLRQLTETLLSTFYEIFHSNQNIRSNFP